MFEVRLVPDKGQKCKVWDKMEIWKLTSKKGEKMTISGQVLYTRKLENLLTFGNLDSETLEFLENYKFQKKENDVWAIMDIYTRKEH